MQAQHPLPCPHMCHLHMCHTLPRKPSLHACPACPCTRRSSFPPPCRPSASLSSEHVVHIELLGSSRVVQQALPQGNNRFQRGGCDSFTLDSSAGACMKLVARRLHLLTLNSSTAKGACMKFLRSQECAAVAWACKIARGGCMRQRMHVACLSRLPAPAALAHAGCGLVRSGI